MSLIFNGTSSKGVYSGNLATGGYPYAIFAWIKCATVNTEGMVAGFASGQGTFDEVAIYSHGGTGKLRGYHKGSGSVAQPASVSSQSTSWQPVLVVATSALTTVYYAAGGPGTDSTIVNINPALPTTFTVGVWPETGNSLFFSGEIAEVWVWRGTVPDATDFSTLAGGALPETVKTANIVEGWTLQNQAASQTGYNGRTMTMTSTTQGSAHPITRIAGPTLSSPTISGVTATTATPGITTSASTGTLYVVMSTTNTAPTAAQVRAGQNAAGAVVVNANVAVTSSGAKTLPVTGLSASTLYYPFWVHRDVGSTDSAVTAGTSFTTSAAAATAITITPPGSVSGLVGVASGNYTVGANGAITGTIVVTPSDSGGGGTFTPTTVSISSGSPTATFTYTPGSAGTKTISVTNNGGLTNPGSSTYTASTLPKVTASVTNNTGTSLVTTTIPKVGIYKLSDMTSVLLLTNKDTNSSGQLVIADAALTVGVDYVVVALDATGSKVGVQKVTAT